MTTTPTIRDRAVSNFELGPELGPNVGMGVISSDIPGNCLNDPGAIYLEALAKGAIPLNLPVPISLFAGLGVRSEFQLTNTAKKALTSTCKGVLDEGNETTGNGTAPTFPEDTNNDGVIDEKDTPTKTTEEVDSGIGSDATIGGEIDLGPRVEIGAEVELPIRDTVSFVGAAYFSLDHLWALTPGQTFGPWGTYGNNPIYPSGHTDFMFNASAGVGIGENIDVTLTGGIGNRTADAMSPDGVNSITTTNSLVASGGLSATYLFHPFDNAAAQNPHTATITPISDSDKRTIIDAVGIPVADVATKTKMSTDQFSLWFDVTNKGIKDNQGNTLTDLILKKEGEKWLTYTMDLGNDPFNAATQQAVGLLGTETTPSEFISLKDLVTYLTLVTKGYKTLLSNTPVNFNIPEYTIKKIDDYLVFLPKKIWAEEGADTVTATISAPATLTHPDDKLALFNEAGNKVMELPLKAGLSSYKLTKDQLQIDLEATPNILTPERNDLNVKVAAQEVGLFNLRVITGTVGSLTGEDIGRLKEAVGNTKVTATDGADVVEGLTEFRLFLSGKNIKDANGTVLDSVFIKRDGGVWKVYKENGNTGIKLDTGATAKTPAEFELVAGITTWIKAYGIEGAKVQIVNGKPVIMLPQFLVFKTGQDTPPDLTAVAATVNGFKDGIQGQPITVYGFASSGGTDATNISLANGRGTNVVTGLKPLLDPSLQGKIEAHYYLDARTKGYYTPRNSDPYVLIVIGDVDLSSMGTLPSIVNPVRSRSSGTSRSSPGGF